MWFHSFVKTKKKHKLWPAAHTTISYYFFGFKKNLKHNGPWWARAPCNAYARARVKRALVNEWFLFYFWFFVFSFLFFFLLNANEPNKTLEKTQMRILFLFLLRITECMNVLPQYIVNVWMCVRARDCERAERGHKCW